MYKRHSCPCCGLDEDYLCVDGVEYVDEKLIFTMYCENCDKTSLIIYRDINESTKKKLKEMKII